MISQTWEFGKAIRPLFTDPVTIDHYGARYLEYGITLF